MKIDMNKVNTGLAEASTLFPQIMAAYTAYKAIWMATHPNATEDDFVAALGDAAQKNISASDAILAADGYVKDANGAWQKPSA